MNSQADLCTAWQAGSRRLSLTLAKVDLYSSLSTTTGYSRLIKPENNFGKMREQSNWRGSSNFWWGWLDPPPPLLLPPLATGGCPLCQRVNFALAVESTFFASDDVITDTPTSSSDHGPSPACPRWLWVYALPWSNNNVININIVNTKEMLLGRINKNPTSHTSVIIIIIIIWTFIHSAN